MKNGKYGSTTIIPLILVAAIVVLFIFLIAQNVKNKAPEEVENYVEQGNGTKVNTSSDVSKEKKVGDVVIEKSQLIYSGGITKLTSKVTNLGIETKNGIKFKIKFIANDKTVMAESEGYIGAIKPGEVRYINSSITRDVVDAKDIVYEIVK